MGWCEARRDETKSSFNFQRNRQPAHFARRTSHVARRSYKGYMRLVADSKVYRDAVEGKEKVSSGELRSNELRERSSLSFSRR